MSALRISDDPIRVGIIGLSASGSWAERSHLPALRALDGYEVRALSTRSAESASASGAKHGVPLTFGSAEALAACDEVDLVVVSVRVPRHRELVTTALSAGKSVLCEWPLGNGLAEAEDLARLARQTNVTAVVGLQARSSPAVRFLATLIADGYVGEVLSTSILGSGRAWGAQIGNADSHYLLDESNGATMLTIPFGHTLDGVASVLGEFESLNATLATRRPEILDAESRSIVSMSAADQIAVTGQLSSGAVASMHFRGGMSRGTNFHWEINGTEGDIIVSADSGHLQFSNVTIRGAQASAALEVIEVPAAYHRVSKLDPVADASAYAVAHAYRQLRDDLIDGTSLAPNFDHAVSRHRVIEDIKASATQLTAAR